MTQPPPRRRAPRHRSVRTSNRIIEDPPIFVAGLAIVGLLAYDYYADYDDPSESLTAARYSSSEGAGVEYGESRGASEPPEIAVGGGSGRSDRVGGAVTIPSPLEDTQVNNLPIQFSIVVPSTDSDGQLSAREFENRIEETKRWMSGQFGGDTTVRGQGDYVDEEDDLIEEDVAVVEASMGVDTYMDNMDAIGEFIKQKHDEWEQDTVLYKIEGRAFIYPERGYIDDSDLPPEGLIEAL